MMNKMIITIKKFMKEFNSTEMKELRQEAALNNEFYYAGCWMY